jgi:uncharacterized repeat protein (TIGR02543 family)
MRKITLLQRVLKIFGISAITILFFACSHELKIQEQQGKATVSFIVTDSPARTVLPQVSLDDDVASYELLGGRNGDAETVLVESFTGTGTSVSLDPGTWNFTLNAYNSLDEHILQGIVHDKQINLTGLNQVSFSLSVLNSGTGSIEITIKPPVEAGITNISTNGDTGSEDLSLDSNGNFVYSIDEIDAGDYFINFELYCVDVLRTVVSEQVLVRRSLISSKIIELVGEDLNRLLTGTVSIVGSAVVGETLTADPSGLDGNGFINYRWKCGDSETVTGTDIANATAGTYTLVAEDEGKYITVTVTRDGYVGEVTSLSTDAIAVPIPVTLTSVTADGGATQTTTVLTLTFSQVIIDLTAADITLNSDDITDVVNKGVLSGSGSSYTLPISGFTSGGALTVAVTKPGYTITDSPKTVTVYHYAIPVTFSNVTADGSPMQTTTVLTLSFNKVISGLTKDDIALDGVSGVEKDDLSGSGPNYILAISGFTEGGTLTVSVSKPSYTISGSSKTVDIYANYYTVTFNTNSGSGTIPATQTINAGSSITLPSGSGLSRNGYAFNGWNTSSNGTGTNYNANTSYTPTSDITLYASWLTTYTVTFNINSGNGTTPAAQTIIAGSSITLPSGSGLTRSGCMFGGWNTNSSGTGTNYNASSSYTPTGNITLYARWRDGTEANPLPLTFGAWFIVNNTTITNTVWFSFEVISGLRYAVWWNDSYEGNSTQTLDVKVSAFYSDGTSIFTDIDSGWTTPQTINANRTDTVKIKVAPYFSGSTGTFAVSYNGGY